MIISKTPLRISFTGGGSDLPQYFNQNDGAVLSSTINKYIYVLVNKKYDDKILLSYSRKENISDVSKIKHKILKETLKHFKIKKSLEIASIADIPSKGSGLGSSSAFTNGLVLALSKYKQLSIGKKELAHLSSYIEIKKCNHTIGFQDQYATSYGNLNLIEFSKKKISIRKLKCKDNTIKKLQDNILLFDTNIKRNASDILKNQVKNIQKNSNINEYMKRMVDLTYMLYNDLSNNNISNFGEILDENWNLKKRLSSNISNKYIDHYYSLAKKNGALGGKLLGAGKGGYLMIYAKKNNHIKIIRSLNFLKNLNIKFEKKGSEIIFSNE